MAGEFLVAYRTTVWVVVDPEARKVNRVVVDNEDLDTPIGYVPAEKIAANGWVDEDVVPLTDEVRERLAEAELSFGWPAWQVGW